MPPADETTCPPSPKQVMAKVRVWPTAVVRHQMASISAVSSAKRQCVLLTRAPALEGCWDGLRHAENLALGVRLDAISAEVFGAV